MTEHISPVMMSMVGVCNACEHHRMDHDEQEYPKITFCHLCGCNEYCDAS